MEQVGVQAINPESIKPQFIAKNEMTSLWNSKKSKKDKVKNFFQFIKSLTEGNPAKKTPETVAALHVKKSDQNKHEDIKPSLNLILTVGKKTGDLKGDIKTDSHEKDEAQEINEKSGKLKQTKDKKNGIEELVSDQVKAFLQNSRTDEKKIKPQDNRVEVADDNGSKQKISEPSEKHAKTVVIDLRKINQSKNDEGSGKDRSATNIDIPVNGKTAGPNTDSILFFGNADELKTGNKTTHTSDTPAPLLSQDNIQRFQDILNHELVSNTRFILREGGGGEIQIELKPESLGKLKFKVNLENNRIDGKIFVENDSIRELVEQSIQNLSHTLLDEGFASVNLQVAVGGDNKRNTDSDRHMAGGYDRIEELGYAVPSLEKLDLADSTMINMIV